MWSLGEDDQATEFVLSAEESDSNGDDAITIRIRAAADETPLRLEDALCDHVLPQDASLPYYDTQVQGRPTSDSPFYVLVERRQMDDERLLDAPIFQVALLVDIRPESRHCEVVAEESHSELDGGLRLSLHRADEGLQLRRSGEQAHQGFCGDSSYLDGEYYDRTKGRFVGADIDKLERKPHATLGAEHPQQPLSPPLMSRTYSWLSASSDWEASKRDRAPSRPRQLQSFELDHPWLEGRDGLGVGEYVTAAIEPEAPLVGLRIFPGHAHSPESFQGFASPTRLMVTTSDASPIFVDLPALSYEELMDTDGLWLAFEEPLTTQCLTVTIVEASAGDGTVEQAEEVVAISALTPYSIFDRHDPAEAAERLLESVVQSYARRTRDRLAELGSPIGDEMVGAIEVLLREGEDPDTRARAVRLLEHYATELALPVLIDHLDRVDVDHPDYRQTRRALAAHGPRAAAEILTLHEAWEEEDDRKLRDTTRLVGRIGGDREHQRLVDRLGHGGDELRSTRIRALVQGGLKPVPQLMDAAQTGVDEPHGEDALTALVFIGRRHIRADNWEQRPETTLVELYDNSEQRSFRMRLLEALAYFPELGSRELLSQALSSDPDAVIRAQAARSFRLYDDPDTTRDLASALDDDSPDVRIEAIRTLRHRGHATAVMDDIIAYVRSESWPKGLHHGLYLMGRGTDEASKQALIEVLHDNLHTSTGAVVLRAMRRGERPLPRAEIESLLESEDLPVRLTKQLINMLGMTQQEWADRLLMSMADRQYEPHLHHEQMILDRLERRALLALGVSRSETAARYLLDAAVDESRSHRTRKRAFRGLGFFHSEEVLQDLQELENQVDSELQRAYEDALAMIQNRLNIDDAEREIHDIMRRVDELNRRPPR